MNWDGQSAGYGFICGLIIGVVGMIFLFPHGVMG